MIIFLSISVAIWHFAASETVKLFLPNTNYWNKDNWQGKAEPCLGNHLVFPRNSPKIFLNGVSKRYEASEIVLPMNGELIIDDMVQIRAAQLSEYSEHSCETSVSHYDKTAPDRWYDPKNWCQTAAFDSSRCLRKPQIEASIVPCASDLVVFPSRSSFYVGVARTEPSIKAGTISLRGRVYYNSLLLRQRIRRPSFNRPLEFLVINSTNVPIIELSGSRIYSINSNLQRMDAICKYVSCKPNGCRQPIKPKGSCCQICGQILVVSLLRTLDKNNFATWVTKYLEDTYQDKIQFDLLSTGVLETQLTLTSNPEEQKDLQQTALEIRDKIRAEMKTITIGTVQCISCSPVVNNSGRERLIIILIVFLLVVVTIPIIFWRKRFVENIPRIPVWKPRFQWPSIHFNFFYNPFSKTRLNEQPDASTITASTLSSIFPGGIEAIELPDTSNEISFDNPIFSPEIDDSKQ